MENKTFATNLKRRRESLKLNQKDLGCLCNPPVPSSKISLLENNKASPNLELITQLKLALNCSYEYLIDDHEEVRKIRNDQAHIELVKKAVKWLYEKECWFVFKEFSAGTREFPDAIGFRENTSILVECKTTEASFKCESKKPFRIDPELGVGHHRYYMCPDDVIKVEDLPDGWGLIYVHVNNVRVIHGNNDNNLWDVSVFKANEDKERKMIRTALKRTIHRL